MKLKLTKNFLILFVLAVFIAFYSCADDYRLINIGNHGGNQDGNPKPEGPGPVEDEEEEDLRPGIIKDLEDSKKIVEKEFSAEDLGYIDSALKTLKVKIYARAGRTDTLTQPIIVFAKDMFNDGYEKINTWIDSLYAQSDFDKQKVSFIVVTNYRTPDNKYEYKAKDNSSWEPMDVNSFADLHTLGTLYKQNVRYTKGSKLGLPSTIEDLSKAIDTLIMPNLKAWHMDSTATAVVSIGMYITTAALHAVGNSNYKTVISKINGFNPIIAFSAGSPYGDTPEIPNLDYKNIEHITGTDTNLRKAFSHFRLSNHFLKSYINSNATSAQLDKYNIIKEFGEANKFSQKIYVLGANEDALTNPSRITGKPFMLRDNMVSPTSGLAAVVDDNANLDINDLDIGTEGGGYHNWPASDNELFPILKDLIENNILTNSNP